MLSAYNLSGQADAAKEAGANGFITRPPSRLRLAYEPEQFIGAASMEEPETWELARCSCVGKRILLVEDNTLNQEVAVEMLVESDIPSENVDVAKGGQAAMDRIKASWPGTYDLTLTDMQVPVMNGRTAAIQVRALPCDDTETVPVVAMTASAPGNNREKTKDAGIDGHLTKPVEPNQLRQVLET